MTDRIELDLLSHIIVARNAIGNIKAKGEDLRRLNRAYEELHQVLVKLNSVEVLIADDPITIH